MSNTDENLSPENKGGSKNKKLAEDKQVQGQDVEQQLIIAVDPETKEQFTIKQIQDSLFGFSGKKYDFIPLEKTAGLFVDWNILTTPNYIPIEFENIATEAADICKPFTHLKLIIPMAVYDFYNAMIQLDQITECHARAEDFFQDALLDYIASDILERYGPDNSITKNIIKQLNNLLETFAKDTKIRPNDTFQFTDTKTKEKVTIDAQQLQDLIEGELGESFPLDRE